MTFSEKLRELKAAAGLSEAKLAELSGVPLGSLHTYILGSRRPLFGAVVKLAAALGVTCEAFADCEDLDEPPPKTDASSPPRRGRPTKASATPAEKPPAKKRKKGE